MATPRFMSATNGFLPVPSGIITGYSRDAKSFKLPEYVQYVEVPATTGTYSKLHRDHPMTITNPTDYDWAPGSRAPQANAEEGRFEMNEFMLRRIAKPFTLSEEAVDMAKKYGKWDPIAYESKAAAQKAMTLRTMLVWQSGAGGLALDTPATWGSNVATAADLAGLPGGTWEGAQPQTPVIQKSLFEAARRIHSRTNNTVQPSDLSLVINPVAAIKLAASMEIRDFVKQQASSPAILTEGWSNPNKLWGLPADLHGFKLVVEDAQYISSGPLEAGTNITPTYVKGDASAALIARPGGIDAPYGSKAYSTVQLFWYEYEMAVEMRYDSWHKIHEGRVVDYRTVVSPATESGFLITNILA